MRGVHGIPVLQFAVHGFGSVRRNHQIHERLRGLHHAVARGSHVGTLRAVAGFEPGASHVVPVDRVRIFARRLQDHRLPRRPLVRTSEHLVELVAEVVGRHRLFDGVEDAHGGVVPVTFGWPSADAGL